MRKRIIYINLKDKELLKRFKLHYYHWFQLRSLVVDNYLIASAIVAFAAYHFVSLLLLAAGLHTHICSFCGHLMTIFCWMHIIIFVKYLQSERFSNNLSRNNNLIMQYNVVVVVADIEDGKNQQLDRITSIIKVVVYSKRKGRKTYCTDYNFKWCTACSYFFLFYCASSTCGDAL